MPGAATDTVHDLPSSQDVERSLLGAVLIDGALLGRVEEILAPSDFSWDAHRAVYEAARSLVGRGEGVDLITVQSELEKTGRLARAGGAAYIASLVDRVPDVENVASYARAVREVSVRRQAILASHRAIAGAATSPDPVGAIEGAARELAALGRRAGPQPEAIDGRRLISPGALFEEYAARRTTIVPCALAGLGKVLGGGFETGRNAVVTAPAGGGKTAFVVQSAAHAVTAGDFFAVLALKDGDQWADGLRLAQMAGVDRFALRARDAEAVERAREAMDRYAERVMFYDVTKPGACFEDMAERALRWVDGRGPLVLGTDSIHVFAATEPAKERGMQIYDRIALRFEVMHDFLVANDVAGLTVGQSGRASYSKKRDEENVDLLAALSGGHVAENTVDVLIVATKPNESGTRFLVVPKSRLGGQGSRIPVRYDEERSVWSDAEPAGEEASEPKEARSKARDAARAEDARKAAEGIALLLRRTPDGLTAEDVRESTGRRREWVASVIDDLHARGEIRQEVVRRPDARGRLLPVRVWKWETREPV